VAVEAEDCLPVSSVASSGHLRSADIRKLVIRRTRTVLCAREFAVSIAIIARLQLCARRLRVSLLTIGSLSIATSASHLKVDNVVVLPELVYLMTFYFARITFRVYIGHGRLCVCVCLFVPHRIPTIIIIIQLYFTIIAEPGFRVVLCLYYVQQALEMQKFCAVFFWLYFAIAITNVENQCRVARSLKGNALRQLLASCKRLRDAQLRTRFPD